MTKITYYITNILYYIVIALILYFLIAIIAANLFTIFGKPKNYRPSKNIHWNII